MKFQKRSRQVGKSSIARPLGGNEETQGKRPRRSLDRGKCYTVGFTDWKFIVHLPECSKAPPANFDRQRAF